LSVANRSAKALPVRARNLVVLVVVVPLVLLLPIGPARPAMAAPIQIRNGAGVVDVVAGAARWQVSTTAFDVIHAASLGSKPRLGPGQATIDALGGTVVFGAPSQVTTGPDWVEVRGWADQKKHLWYIGRYQFFADKPFARLVLTVTDRHDSSPAQEQSDRYWKDRILSRFRLEIGAPNGKPSSVTQHNSYSYSTPEGPWVEPVGVKGAPFQWTPMDGFMTQKPFQVAHAARDPVNQVIWHPNFAGTATLTAVISPFSGGSEYKAAKSAAYEIVDAAGKTSRVAGDQRAREIKLGTFTLGKGSIVRLLAIGAGEETALAGTIKVAPAQGRPFEIALGTRHDGVLRDEPVSIAVKDFWQHHPMTLSRTATTIGWEAIQQPARYTGGMGLTIETLIALEGSPAAVTAALYEPPRRTMPGKVHPVDGSLAHNPFGDRYDALLKVFAGRVQPELERLDSFGWRNWGDYQIGTSYSDPNGNQIEDWANEQYDLPLGLLLAWMRTGDPALWRVAQASVRHLMDLDLVKFSPFQDKLNGLIYRKGEMRRIMSHVDAEPVTDQGFAWRSLLLYSELTGEAWARELAKQNIDRLVFYAQTRPHFVLNGGRPTAWMLRAALAGAEWFGGAGGQPYQAVADQIVRQLLDYRRQNNRLPGRQPVWQGQIIEGLAEYHRRTGRADVADLIVSEVRSLLTNGTRRRADGGWDFMYCYRAESDCPQWTDEDNYAFLWLASVAYAFKLSHDPFFAHWAETLFTFGETKMRQHNDVRSWTSALAFPHLFLELAPLR
jgi:hypothetical protein